MRTDNAKVVLCSKIAQVSKIRRNHIFQVFFLKLFQNKDILDQKLDQKCQNAKFLTSVNFDSLKPFLKGNNLQSGE